MRPRGTPPTPRAISSESEPVEIESTFIMLCASPSFMMEPSPYRLRISPTALSSTARLALSTCGVDVSSVAFDDLRGDMFYSPIQMFRSKNLSCHVERSETSCFIKTRLFAALRVTQVV